MNKFENAVEKKWWKNGKIKDILLLATLAFILIFASWKIFYQEDNVETSVAIQTETEKKIGLILQEIEGVGEASVAVCETEEGVLGAVVVCQGANNLKVIMDVREAVATALGTEEKAVKVYLKK